MRNARTAVPLSSVPAAVVEAVRHLEHSESEVSAYIYRPDVAAARAARLRGVLPTWAEVFYAVKANAFPPVLRAVAGVVDGFEVASQQEADLAASAGRANGGRTRLVASGPGKSEANLAGLLQLGVDVINVESALELQRLARLAELLGRRVRVTLRISPEPVRITPTLTIGGATTPFGIAEQQLAAVLGAVPGLPSVELIGFHFHVMCNNLDAEAHAAYVRWCLDWSERTAAAYGVDLRLVDVGGGLGVPAEAEEELNLDLLGERLASLRPPNGARVILEPGRWVVDDCGYYAAEVTDLKPLHGTWFAVLRGGIHQFFRPAAYGTPHDFAVVPRDHWPYAFARPEIREATVTVVGELCTPADVLARGVHAQRLRAGDVLVFPRAGSYGWEMSLQEFLGHPRAARVVAAPPSEGTLPTRHRALERGGALRGAPRASH